MIKNTENKGASKKGEKSPSFHPLVIAEILVLQRFPFGNNSTFFYFASDNLVRVKIGDIVKVPWRRGEIEGVVIKTKRAIASGSNLKSWKVNLSKTIKDDKYFLSPLPNRVITLKPIKEIIQKEFIPYSLLDKLRTISDKYYVSWNHFAKAVCQLPPQKKIKGKITYLKTLGKWVKKIEKNYPKSEVPSKLYLTNELLQTKAKFIFLPNHEQEILNQIVNYNLSRKKQILVIVPEKTHTLPIAAKYSVIGGNNMISSSILLGKFLPSSSFRNNWQLTRSLNQSIFIGTRSSIFAPFSNLGLIILEDGHDASFKEWDRTPRYDVRQITPILYPNPVLKIYLSSTPRFQDIAVSPYYLTKTDNIKVNKLEIKSKEAKRKKQDTKEVPFSKKILISNYLEETKNIFIINQIIQKQLVETDLISKELVRLIKKNIQEHKSTIILANHKGWASMLSCKECGYVPYCPHCNRPLTVSQGTNLFCTFCGFCEKDFTKCPKCQGYNFMYRGMGMDRAKEILTKLDLPLITPPDPKSNFKDISEYWENLISDKPKIILGYSGILPIGSILKKDIGLGAILSFDGLLYHPDFRGDEKAAARFYNLLSFSKEILIQTHNPLHELLDKLAQNSYSSFFPFWNKDRQDFKYPPYSNLIRIEVNDKDKDTAQKKAENISQILKNDPSVIETIVTPSSVSKKRDQYYWCIVVKTKKTENLKKEIAVKILENGKIDFEPEILV